MAAVLALLQPTHPFERVLAGNWQGTLEYRDYQTDRRVTLPTLLNVTAAGGGVLSLSYTYDDGPGKTVRSTERVTIDAGRSTYRVQNGDGTYDATFSAAGLAEIGVSTDTLVLSGKGEENGISVDVRLTIKATTDALTILRESRVSGADWRFRNRYAFARVR